MDKRTDGQTDRQTNGEMDRLVDRQTVMQAQTDKLLQQFHQVYILLLAQPGREPRTFNCNLCELTKLQVAKIL